MVCFEELYTNVLLSGVANDMFNVNADIGIFTSFLNIQRIQVIFCLLPMQEC